MILAGLSGASEAFILMAAMQDDKDNSENTDKREEKVEATSANEASNEGDNMPLGKAIRRYPKTAGYACFVTIAILLWGYDLVVVGTVSSIPAFQ